MALRPHFDATVDKVLVADGAEVKAGDPLIELDARQVRAQLDGRQGAARQGSGGARTGPARRRPLHRSGRALGDAAAQPRQRQDRRSDGARRDPRRPGGDRQPAGAARLVHDRRADLRPGRRRRRSSRATSPRRPTTAPPASSPPSTRSRRSTSPSRCSSRCCRRCTRRWRPAPSVDGDAAGREASASTGKLALVDNSVDSDDRHHRRPRRSSTMPTRSCGRASSAT